MLPRFCLYGFLKNQRYFEAFLVLALLDRGLDFFAIGLLIATRAGVVLLLEIPSGAIADGWGRRASLVAAFLAYVASFLLLGLADTVAWLVLGMALYGVGDSFRSGAHKALIFAWLMTQNRQEERTRIYGFTRAWSKRGSALSVLLGAGLVLALGRDAYRWLFLAAALPSALAALNMLGYPASLEAAPAADRRPPLATLLSDAWREVRISVREPARRRLAVAAMGFDGVFEIVKDYLQPVLQGIAVAGAGAWLLAAANAATLDDAQRAAVLIAPVYAGLFLLAASASRRAHRLVDRFTRRDSDTADPEARAARALWQIALMLYALLTLAAALRLHALLAAGLIALHGLHNLWRPVLIARFDRVADAARGATALSIEGQAKRLAVLVGAPLIGLLVDGAMRVDAPPLLPVAALGLFASTAALVARTR